MPELGKATYIIEIDSRKFDKDLAATDRKTAMSAKSQNAQLASVADSWNGLTFKVHKTSSALDDNTQHVSRSRKELKSFGQDVMHVNQALSLFGKVISAAKIPAFAAGIGYAVKAVGALSAGVIGLTGALAPLSGLLVAYPAILGAVGQAMITFKLAGVEDLTKAMGGNKKAMEELSPTAKKFAKDLEALKPKYEKLQEAVQKPLFQGADKGLHSMMKNFGVFEGIFVKTSKAMGGLAEKAGELFGSKGFGERAQKIGNQNATTLTRMGEAGLKLFDALSHILVAAHPFINWLTDGVKAFGEWADKTAKTGEETGKLTHFFNETKEVMTTLWHTAKNLGDAFFNIGKIGVPLGKELLSVFEKSSEHFDKWTKSIEGKNSIAQWFREAKTPLWEMGRLLHDLTIDLFGLSKSSGLGSFLKLLRVEVLPELKDFLEESTKSFGPVLTHALVSLIQLARIFAGTSGPLVIALKTVTKIAEAVKWMADEIPGAKDVMVTLVGAAALLKGMRWTGALTGLTRMKTAYADVAVAADGAAAAEARAAGASTASLTGTRQLTERERMIIAGGGTLPAAEPVAGAGAGIKGGITGAKGAATSALSTARTFGTSLLAGLTSYGIGGLVVGQMVQEMSNNRTVDRFGQALQGAGIGAAIGSAIEPGIGTAIGAALGGAGGILFNVIAEHKSDFEKQGELYGEHFLKGYEKRLPKIQRMVRNGAIGTTSHTKNVAELPSGAHIQTTTGGTGLRGERGRLQALLNTGLNDTQQKKVEGEVNAISKSIRQILKARETFQQTMNGMVAASAYGMKGINAQIHKGIALANESFHGFKWHEKVADEMRAAVKAIKLGMQSGTVPVKKGKEEINRLLEQIKVTEGKDTFGLAKAAASNFKGLNQITGKGMDEWLKQLEHMPKGAQEQSRAAVNAMLKAWVQGHPKLEAQFKSLAAVEKSRFGAANKSAERTTAQAMEHIVESGKGGSGAFAEALEVIGSNLVAALKPLGVKNIPTWQINRASESAKGRWAAGESMKEAATGYLPGKGLRDTVPIMAAPGEAVVNRHQQRFINTALAKTYGFGLNGLFNRERTPHYMAKGGEVSAPFGEPTITGGIPSLREGEQHGVNQTYKAAINFYNKHAEPPRIKTMLDLARHIASLGLPYTYGGGHNGAFAGSPGYDCSGYVSAILHAGGFLGEPLSVQQGSGLYTLGVPGPGKFFSWGVRGTSGANAHTMMEIKGPGEEGMQFFESGGSGGGPHEDQGWDGGFQIRHIPGFARGGRVPKPVWGHATGPFSTHGGSGDAGVRGRMPARAQQAIQKYGADAFNPHKGHFVGWGYSRGGSIKGPWAGTSIDKTYPPSDGISTGAVLPAYVIQALAEWAGMPGITMYQITEGESSGHPGMDISDPPGRGRGLYAINSVTSGNTQSSAELRNPILNTIAAGELAHNAGGPNANIWHGSSHVTNWNAHWNGTPATIAEHLGGHGIGKEGAKTKALPETVKGKYTKTYNAFGHKSEEEKHFKVSTAQLEFEALPSGLDQLRHELRVRQREVGEYKAAIKDAKKHKRLASALEVNLGLLQKRIVALKAAIRKALIEKHLKNVANHIAKNAEFGGINQRLEGLHEQYEIAVQNAEQIVDLESAEPSGGATSDWITNVLEPYVGKESAAYGGVLGLENTWRNTLIGGEHVGENKIERWRQQITGVTGELKAIHDLKQPTEPNRPGKGANKQAWAAYQAKMDDYRNAMQNYNRAQNRIPGLERIRNQYRSNIKTVSGEVLPGFNDQLKEVQGVGGNKVIMGGLPSTPTAGQFGGLIWGTQETISGLNLRVSEAQAAMGSGEGSGEGTGTGEEETVGSHKEGEEISTQQKLEAQTTLNEELLRKNTALSALNPVFGQFFGHVPKYAGTFHSGGIVPGTPGEERIAKVQAGEIIAQPDSIQAHQHLPQPVMIVEDGAIDQSKIRHIYQDESRRTVSEARRRV